MQQQMLEQDEETVELRETFTTLQQEVELKTKKLKKVKPLVLEIMTYLIVSFPMIPSQITIAFGPGPDKSLFISKPSGHIHTRWGLLA